MRPSPSSRRIRSGARRAGAALLLGAALAGCGADRSSGPAAETGLAEMRVSANVANTTISTILLTVTGTDIPQPLVFNLKLENFTATGTIRLPAGDQRTFVAQAFDAAGAETHDGTKTIDVERGANPPLSIPMVPRSGQLPVTVTVGDYGVTLSPPSARVFLGTPLQLSATVTRPNGDVVTNPALHWASAQPFRATVNETGLVSTVAAGQVQIMASHEGIGGSSSLTVVQGAVFPAPGGTDFSGAGLPFQAGGRTWSYSGFDFSKSSYLAWGVDHATPVGLAMDGAIDAPGELMTLDASTSLSEGKLVFSGSATVTTFPNGNPTAVTLPSRLTITVRDPASVLIALLTPAAAGVPAKIGGALQVTGNFNANYVFELFQNNVWSAAGPAFDAIPFKAPVQGQLRTSVGFGFYSAPR